MCHHQCTNKPGTYSPTCSPHIFLFVFLIQELHIKCFCEILPEKMRSAGLQSLAILHQCLNTISVNSTSKTLTFCFNTANYRQCHEVFSKCCIYFQHLSCLSNSFICRSMCCMPFLP